MESLRSNHTVSSSVKSQFLMTIKIIIAIDNIVEGGATQKIF